MGAEVDPGQDIRLRGFRYAFRTLWQRKKAELGPRWSAIHERFKNAEAKRRAAAEMARRVLRKTGRSLAPSTIRRLARWDRLPQGMDPSWVHRQAHVDRGGGIEAFAARMGVNTYRVTAWRDGGRVLWPRPTYVQGEVNGFVLSGDGRYEREDMMIDFSIQPSPVADEIRIADSFGDLDTIMELLGPLIADNHDWQGAADRDFEVTEVIEITIT